MKRTKSMYYNPTAESRELSVYAANVESVYRTLQAIESNLDRKIAKGIYNSDKAIDAFFTAAEAAAAAYFKEWGYKFTVNERYNAAIELRNDYEIDRNI